MMNDVPSTWIEKALAAKAEHDDYVMRRKAELYPDLCDRYIELKKLAREILTDDLNTFYDPDEKDPVLRRIWEIVTEDGD